MHRELDPSEKLAERLLPALLGAPLERWDTCGRQGAVDFHVVGQSIAVEVKLITNEAFMRGEAHWRRYGQEPMESAVLSRHWNLAVALPSYGQEDLAAPDFRTLAKQAELLLADLEARGIHRLLRDDDVIDWTTISYIPSAVNLLRLLNGGAAVSYPAAGGGQIEVAISHGLIGETSPEALVDCADHYLTGPTSQAENLRHKLASDACDQKHAFLVLDSTSSVWWRMEDWSRDRLPTRLPQFPTEIDQVWIAGYGTLAWWCSREGPWHHDSVSDSLPDSN